MKKPIVQTTIIKSPATRATILASLLTTCLALYSFTQFHALMSALDGLQKTMATPVTGIAKPLNPNSRLATSHP